VRAFRSTGTVDTGRDMRGSPNRYENRFLVMLDDLSHVPKHQAEKYTTERIIDHIGVVGRRRRSYYDYPRPRQSFSTRAVCSVRVNHKKMAWCHHREQHRTGSYMNCRRQAYPLINRMIKAEYYAVLVCILYYTISSYTCHTHGGRSN